MPYWLPVPTLHPAILLFRSLVWWPPIGLHHSQLHGLSKGELVPQACPPAPFRPAGPHAWLHWLEPIKWSWRRSSLQLLHQTSRMAGHTHTPATGHPSHWAQQPPVSRNPTRSESAKAVGTAWWERPMEVWRLSHFPAGCPTALFQPASKWEAEGQRRRRAAWSERRNQSPQPWSHCSSSTITSSSPTAMSSLFSSYICS